MADSETRLREWASRLRDGIILKVDDADGMDEIADEIGQLRIIGGTLLDQYTEAVRDITRLDSG